MPVIAVVGAPGSKKKELADYIYLLFQKNDYKAAKIYNYADIYLHNCFEQQGFPKDGKHFNIDQRHVMQKQCVLEKDIPHDCYAVLSSALMVNYCIAIHKAYSGDRKALDNDIPEYFSNVVEMSNNYDLVIYLPTIPSSYEKYLDDQKLKKIEEIHAIDKEIRRILEILDIDYEIFGDLSRKARKIRSKQVLREKFPELMLNNYEKCLSHETNFCEPFEDRKAEGRKKWNKTKKGEGYGR
ncbi:MAG TPA: hypothetical protein PLA41_00725 [Candidatus Pacearchaeota archaeon]|nr:hypothetical protein [Candidatus Parcubacteria bacterium]HOU45660.1 hypothetical protein [Candidatus Pacearchaeota archaeon]HPM08278.1 hypothetical protein [Candidatus Pacearchaeota archaeon]HQI74589.1 hypothetical protein [Candidatus Pacearchaeota archaeon]